MKPQLKRTRYGSLAQTTRAPPFVKQFLNKSPPSQSSNLGQIDTEQCDGYGHLRKKGWSMRVKI